MDDPRDPLEWGIDARTAAQRGRFGDKGLGRVSLGRISEVWPPRLVSERVPQIARLARSCDQGRWYWETTPPHPEFRRLDPVDYPSLNSWTVADDAVLAAAWPSELNTVVDEFIEVYGSAWHVALGDAKPHSTAVGRFVSGLVESGALDRPARKGYTRAALRAYKVSSALTYGVFNVTVERRSWPFPTRRICACCGAEHYFDLARHYMIRSFGRPGICAPCMHGARYGELAAMDFTAGQILAALRDFAELTGTVPSAKSFRESLLMPGLSESDRGIAVALLLTIPTSDEVLAITNCSSWSKVLQTAGIAKPVRGRPRQSAPSSQPAPAVVANDDQHSPTLDEQDAPQPTLRYPVVSLNHENTLKGRAKGTPVVQIAVEMDDPGHTVVVGGVSAAVDDTGNVCLQLRDGDGVLVHTFVLDQEDPAGPLEALLGCELGELGSAEILVGLRRLGALTDGQG